MERLGMDVLLLHIFARLEIHELGRLRCVCRSWRGGIGSEEFARLWEGRARPCSVLRIRHLDTRPRLGQFHTQVWYPEDRRSSSSSGSRSGLRPGPGVRLCVGISGSSRGLVCGLLVPDGVKDASRWKCWSFDREWEFVVGNPVTNRWRTLPPLRVPQRKIIGSIECIHLQVDVEQQSCRYHLVLLYRDSLNSRIVYHALHFDSASGSWSSPEPFTGEEEAEGGIDGASECAFGTRNLYTPHHLLAGYLPASRSWSCYRRFAVIHGDEASMPEKAELFQVGEDGGVSCLCGVVWWRGKAIMVSHSFSCVVVSELDAGGGVWKVLSSRRYTELYSSCAGEFESGERAWSVVPQLAGDLLLLTQQFGWGMSPLGVYAPIAFNLQLFTWHVYHSPYPFRSVDVESSFTFIPSFTSQP